MFSLFFPRVIARTVTLVLALSPCLSYAAPPQGQGGVLVEFNWNVGDVHPYQSRWQANFALGSSGNIVRSMYETASINGSVDDLIEYDYFAGYYQERSLMPLHWSTDSMGNSYGRLYGVPVVTKFSPSFNASESSTGSGSSIASDPWVWLGAVVVGLAAASSSDGGSSDSGGASTSNSCGTNGGTVVGNGGAVNTDDPSDPRGPSVDTGCIN